jgi:hypothetical protein
VFRSRCGLGALQGGDDFVGIRRLAQIVVGTPVQRLRRRVRRSKSAGRAARTGPAKQPDSGGPPGTL